MHSCPEGELLRLARLFDQAALAELYDRYSDSIYYYSLRLLGDASLAEDCAADTFSRLLRALRDGGGPTENLKAYLFRSAHNWIADNFRRMPPSPLDPEGGVLHADSDPVQEAEQNLTQDRLRRAIRLLTPEQQQVVALRFIEGWEPEEIAACLGKTLGAVKALQHRAVTTLRKMLLEEESIDHELQS